MGRNPCGYRGKGVGVGVYGCVKDVIIFLVEIGRKNSHEDGSVASKKLHIL